jgi:hypothetical protein
MNDSYIAKERKRERERERKSYNSAKNYYSYGWE